MAVGRRHTVSKRETASILACAGYLVHLPDWRIKMEDIWLKPRKPDQGLYGFNCQKALSEITGISSSSAEGSQTNLGSSLYVHCAEFFQPLRIRFPWLMLLRSSPLSPSKPSMMLCTLAKALRRQSGDACIGHRLRHHQPPQCQQ